MRMQLSPALFMVVRGPERTLGKSEPVRRAPAVALDDEELARRIGRGDRWAEEALYRRYLSTVYGRVRRLLGNSADAEDVTQDTFACAFEIWEQLREPAQVKPWLLQIAVRKVHRRFRKRKLLRALGLDRSVDDVTLAGEARAEASGEARAELAVLDRLLKQLPVAERLAWMLRHVEGLKLEEVAADCECSLATAKRRIAAAQARVAVHLNIEGADDV